MVIAAPAILSQVKVSPSVSQAITPATGGIRYMKGALRASPRTLLTQAHAIQPRKEHTTSAQNSAAQTEKAIDSLLVATRSGSRMNLGTSIQIEDDLSGAPVTPRRKPVEPQRYEQQPLPRRDAPVTYINQARNIPSINSNFEPISNRFSDRTITQACTLLLREAGSPLHVNELYNLLIAGGMKFKGNNPTISIAVSLNRNRRFRKVDPGTFDLVMREANRAAS